MSEPKILQILDQSGNVTDEYPITITKAVLDLASNQSLDIILDNLQNKKATIVKDDHYQYHLEVDGQRSGDVIDIDNSWLESVSYNHDTKKFKFIFSTRQGIVTIYIRANEYLNQYYADEQTITLDGDKFRVIDGVFASAQSGELANTALQYVSGDSNTQYLILSTSDKVGSGTDKQQTIHAEVSIGSMNSDSDGFALTQDVKQYVQELTGNNCTFENVNNINYPDISSYFNG